MVCGICDCRQTLEDHQFVIRCTSPDKKRTFEDVGTDDETGSCNACKQYVNSLSQIPSPSFSINPLHGSTAHNRTHSTINPSHGSTAHNRPHNKRGGIDTSVPVTTTTNNNISSSPSTDNNNSSTIFGLDRNTALLLGGGGLLLVLVLITMM